MRGVLEIFMKSVRFLIFLYGKMIFSTVLTQSVWKFCIYNVMQFGDFSSLLRNFNFPISEGGAGEDTDISSCTFRGSWYYTATDLKKLKIVSLLFISYSIFITMENKNYTLMQSTDDSNLHPKSLSETA